MEVLIDGWRSNLIFSSAHFLPDYSKCSRLHGHTYAVHVRIVGKIKNGILIDFRKVKEEAKKIIDEIDHRIIIPTEGKLEIKEGKDIEIKYNNKRYVFPAEDCAFLPIYSSSAENIASYILKKLKNAICNENIERIEVGVDEGYGQGAWAKWEK